MKKMTGKEFKEILDEVGIYFEIFGYEGILNLLSCELKFEAERANELGLHMVANDSMEKSDSIYDILKARGYYDDIIK